ncbi:biotin-dependent carboxyltransferase family protein [Marinobacter sp. X15-166B]|uniref:5-oxoprolinase subunit C family protein n=1 Tax=Marinobacter sp. X15-166B TaxID=1897620 RepID=UPI0022439C11|nr:hypothetical protein [Marinobacter sp. X15-166B]
MTERSRGLKVIKAGFLTLLQDAGRTRVMHQGLASGGAMDRHAWAWANRLLGNAYHTPTLEVTFGSLELESRTTTRIAVTGAAVPCTINGNPHPLWRTLQLYPGDRLQLGTPKSGLRSYLAVSGGFAVTQGLGGSCATLVREGTGGLHDNGQPVRDGDELPCGSPPSEAMSNPPPAGFPNTGFRTTVNR